MQAHSTAFHTPLGRWLVSLGKLSEADLEAALAYKVVRGVKLGQALTSLGLVSERDLADALRRQGRVHSIQLTPRLVDHAIAVELGRESASSLLALPINRIAGVTTVAMEDPADSYSVDEIALRLGTPVLAVHAEPTRIRECIDDVFHVEVDHATPAVTRNAVEQCIDQALELGAQCVLFERHSDGWPVRARAGAQMHELGPTGLDETLTQLAKLDCTSLIHAGKRLELALTTVATLRGPRVAVHIRRAADATSEELLDGFDAPQHAAFEHVLTSTPGLIVVTGARADERSDMLRAVAARLHASSGVHFTFDAACLHSHSGAAHVVAADDTRSHRREMLARVLAHEPQTLVIGNVDDRVLVQRAVRAAAAGTRVVIELIAPSCAAAFAMLRALDVEPRMLKLVLRGVIASREVLVKPMDVDAQ